MTLVAIPDDTWFHGLPEVPGVETTTWDFTSPHPRQDEIVLAVPPYSAKASYALTKDMPSLRYVQLLSAGFDDVIPQLPESVTLCNAAGLHDTSTAELALTLALAASRDIPEFVRNQATGTWPKLTMHESIADKKVTVVGYGNIGRAIVKRFQVFESEVRVVASRARGGDDLVDAVHGIDELPELAKDTQILVLIVPLTERTEGLVDADLLTALPDGALVVNVARGKIIDTNALLAQLQSGRLRAALDVTDPEPLPADHPLWQAPHTLISPHTGGGSTAFTPRAVALVEGQLRRLAAGEQLEHVVRAGTQPETTKG